jgi:carbamoyltransferase
MNYIGISCGFHDAAISVVSDKGEVLFADHSERYSKIKHDKHLSVGLIEEALKHAGDDYELHYYERPVKKYLRRLRAGEKPSLLSMFTCMNIGLNYTKLLRNGKYRTLHTHDHHLTHAAAGFQTSSFDDATVVVIDSIGEFETITIWDATYKNGKAQYKKLYSQTYPDSIGLFYSAMTKRVGLKPLDEEYILMGMSAYGEPKHYSQLHSTLIEDSVDLTFKDNLHVGLPENFLEGADNMDIANSSQLLVEHLIGHVMFKARMLGKSKNLVYSGGVALNCLANRNLGKYFEQIWIMPNPGDAGSSLGSAALGYRGRINFSNSYLGYCIPGTYPVDDLLNELLTKQIVGVASGHAEFGPRALGNRSLLGDPRGIHIKEQINDIKRRQQYRPFAPVILEELVHEYFIMPNNWDNSRYMQVVSTCRFPDLFPAIVHHDGTSRVQTVPKDGSGIRKLLEAWYKETGCPMLLNTSLNIRGEPIVNDRDDADRFENTYKVKVCS